MPFIPPFKTVFLPQINGKINGGAVHFAVRFVFSATKKMLHRRAFGKFKAISSRNAHKRPDISDDKPRKMPAVDGLLVAGKGVEKIFNKFPKNYKNPLALKKDYE